MRDTRISFFLLINVLWLIALVVPPSSFAEGRVEYRQTTSIILTDAGQPANRDLRAYLPEEYSPSRSVCPAPCLIYSTAVGARTRSSASDHSLQKALLSQSSDQKYMLMVNNEKPTIDGLRVAGEILSGLGMATGSTIVLRLYYYGYIYHASDEFPDSDEFPHPAKFYFLLLAPINYTFFSALGVYLVGNTGNETGSFGSALLGSTLGMAVDVILFATLAFTEDSLADYLFGQHPKKTLAIMIPIVLAVPPVMATIYFNRSREYKTQPAGSESQMRINFLKFPF